MASIAIVEKLARTSTAAQKFWIAEGVEEKSIKSLLTYKCIKIPVGSRAITAILNGLQAGMDEATGILNESLAGVADKTDAITAEEEIAAIARLIATHDGLYEMVENNAYSVGLQNEVVRSLSGLPELPEGEEKSTGAARVDIDA